MINPLILFFIFLQIHLITLIGCYDTGYGCARHAFKGDCNVQTWKRYLSTKCRRSCGLCGDSTGTGRPVTYPPYTRPTAKVTTSIGVQYFHIVSK